MRCVVLLCDAMCYNMIRYDTTAQQPNATEQISAALNDKTIHDNRMCHFGCNSLCDVIWRRYLNWLSFVFNSIGYRYYLNIDRCAAGGLKAGVQGPELYVINDECNAAYYLHGPHGYKRYKSGTHFECSFTPSCAVCPAVYKNHKPLRVKLRR